MKRKLAIAAFSAALLAGPQALAQLPHQANDPAGTSIDPSGDGGPRTIQMPPDPEGKAEELRLHGQCDEAVPILRRLSNNDNDDIAQFNLGQCLLDLGKTEPNAQRAASLKHEGVGWVLRMANRGLPNAQSSLIAVYLDGAGVPPDPVEAAKWALIYHGNGTRMAIGMPDIPHDLAVRLDKALTAKTWDEAQSRANAWSSN
jgi:TPR repeat protein